MADLETTYRAVGWRQKRRGGRWSGRTQSAALCQPSSENTITATAVTYKLIDLCQRSVPMSISFVLNIRNILKDYICFHIIK